MKEEEKKGHPLPLSLPRKATSLANAVTISTKQVNFTTNITTGWPSTILMLLIFFRSRRGRDSASPSRRKHRTPSDESIEEGELSEDELERKRMQLLKQLQEDD